MQNDDVIWDIIRHHHCSFMAKVQTGIFCRNPYNVTGICNRSSCPLANSRYATIRDHDEPAQYNPGASMYRLVHLYNVLKMEYWPKLLVHKIKQRLTKMTQYRIRMVKLSKKVREKIMTVPTKEKKRESRREEKALRAAQIENVIEKELLERLNKGVYADICNYDEEIFKKFLDENKEDEQEVEEEGQVEYVELEEEEEEELDDDIEDFDILKDTNIEDIKEHEDLEQRAKKKVKQDMNVEVEQDEGAGRQRNVMRNYAY